jgi:N-acyl-D-aspartate/D-glutamate deacylase
MSHSRRVPQRLILFTSIFFFLSTSSAPAQETPRSTVILNAQIADGTGKPLRKANVRVVADRIADVGNFKPKTNEHTIDARDLVLAPGFIDIHNHSTEGLESDPLAESQIAQGITAVILGADGDSPWPIDTWLDAFAKPFELPAGIEKVFVNGELVWDSGKPTGARPGRVSPGL